MPQNLHDKFRLVLSRENGTEAPNRVSAKNFDGTYDLGCLQLNTIHFKSKGWNVYGDVFNPDLNVKVAYQIWQTRGFKAWYAVCPPSGANPFGLC